MRSRDKLWKAAVRIVVCYWEPLSTWLPWLRKCKRSSGINFYRNSSSKNIKRSYCDCPKQQYHSQQICDLSLIWIQLVQQKTYLSFDYLKTKDEFNVSFYHQNIWFLGFIGEEHLTGRFGPDQQGFVENLPWNRVLLKGLAGSSLAI